MKIDKYMSPNEAAYRWGESIENVKERLKPSRNKNLDKLIEEGIIKYYRHPDKSRGEWIVSRDFMERFYGKESKKD